MARSDDEKGKSAAYSAATTALRKKYDEAFTLLLQAEYTARGLGQAPPSRATLKRQRDEKARSDIAAKLERKRQELADLEAAAIEAGIVEESKVSRIA